MNLNNKFFFKHSSKINIKSIKKNINILIKNNRFIDILLIGVKDCYENKILKLLKLYHSL